MAALCRDSAETPLRSFMARWDARPPVFMLCLSDMIVVCSVLACADQSGAGERPEPKMHGLFHCLWEGIRNPAEIGRRLGVSEREAVRLRKRFDRKVAAFVKRRKKV